MSLSRKLSALATSSEGRGRLATLTSILVLASLLVLVLAVLPAGAGDGSPSGLLVQPDEHNLGGQANDCSVTQGDLPSAGQYEFRIVNPQTLSYTDPGPGGATFTLKVFNNEKFDFTISGGSVYDVVVKGGQKSTHFDYDGSLIGATASDTGLHAPTKGNSQTNLYALSHTTFCYSTLATISGTVFHDVDLDGTYDGAVDQFESERAITVYDSAGEIVAGPQASAADGSYEFTLPIGPTYTVCEADKPLYGQTTPEGNACEFLGNSEDAGHVVTLIEDSLDNDFGNAREACGGFFEVTNNTFSNAAFTIFEDGNNLVSCSKEVASLYFVSEGDEVGFVFGGTGPVAAIGVIEKDFGPLPAFVPLQYRQSLSDGLEEVPSCGLREKASGDGDEFDGPSANPWIPADKYPTLTDVTDPVSGDDSTACKVYERQDATGYQLTVLYVEDDPYFR